MVYSAMEPFTIVLLDLFCETNVYHTLFIGYALQPMSRVIYVLSVTII